MNRLRNIACLPPPPCNKLQCNHSPTGASAACSTSPSPGQSRAAARALLSSLCCCRRGSSLCSSPSCTPAAAAAAQPVGNRKGFGSFTEVPLPYLVSCTPRRHTGSHFPSRVMAGHALFGSNQQPSTVVARFCLAPCPVSAITKP
jgi:hypothetical protein